MKQAQPIRLLISAAAICALLGASGAARAAAKQESLGLPAPPQPVTDALEKVSLLIEVTGTAVIVIGALLSILLIARDWNWLPGLHERYKAFRANLGRSILLGLEFLVAADIIGTVATEPTYESLGLLAIVILLRTFLSFSLETEIQGRFPWREAELERKASGQS